MWTESVSRGVNSSYKQQETSRIAQSGSEAQGGTVLALDVQNSCKEERWHKLWDCYKDFNLRLHSDATQKSEFNYRAFAGGFNCVVECFGLEKSGFFQSRYNFEFQRILLAIRILNYYLFFQV